MRILVVCTDRGAHKPLPIAHLVVTDRGDTWNVQLRPAVDSDHDPHAETRIQYDLDSRGAAQLTCPRCRTTARQTMRNWARVASMAASSGMSRLDLATFCAKLPF